MSVNIKEWGLRNNPWPEYILSSVWKLLIIASEVMCVVGVLMMFASIVVEKNSLSIQVTGIVLFAIGTFIRELGSKPVSLSGKIYRISSIFFSAGILLILLGMRMGLIFA